MTLTDIPVIKYKNPRNILALISRINFFSGESSMMKMISVRDTVSIKMALMVLKVPMT
jgi:hypothetical protein